MSSAVLPPSWQSRTHRLSETVTTVPSVQSLMPRQGWSQPRPLEPHSIVLSTTLEHSLALRLHDHSTAFHQSVLGAFEAQGRADS